MKRTTMILLTAASLALGTLPVRGQGALLSAERRPAQLVESGQIVLAGQPMAYLIRHLPVSSFPSLPAAIADQLNQRGCLIPQTYEAHGPENVIHASL